MNIIHIEREREIDREREMTLNRKHDYRCQLSDKLSDPEAIAKTYWSIFKNL